jgi:hypothetical protein
VNCDREVVAQRRKETCDGQQQAEYDEGDGRPPRQPTPDDPGYRGFHADRDEQCQADQDESVTGDENGLDHADHDRDPRRGGHPDEERRTAIERFTRPAERLVRASDALGYGFRFCHRVLEVATRLCEPLVVPFLCVVSSGLL